MYNVKGGWKSERRLPPSFRLPSVQRRQTRKMKIFEACRQPLCILHNSGNPFISTDCASMYQRATHDSQPTRTSFSYVRYGRSTFLFFFFLHFIIWCLRVCALSSSFSPRLIDSERERLLRRTRKMFFRSNILRLLGHFKNEDAFCLRFIDRP